MRKSKLSSMYLRELQVEASVAKSCDMSRSDCMFGGPTPCVQRHLIMEVVTKWSQPKKRTIETAKCLANSALAKRLWFDTFSHFRLFSSHEWPRYVECQGSSPLDAECPDVLAPSFPWREGLAVAPKRSRQTTQWLAQTQCLGAQSGLQWEHFLSK